MDEVTKKRTFNIARVHAKKDILKDLSHILTSELVPADPKEDIMTKLYNELCDRMREKQTYFLPVGLSPWHLRSTILSLDILNQGTPKNVTVRTMLSEISKAIVKVMLDEYERTGESAGPGNAGGGGS